MDSKLETIPENHETSKPKSVDTARGSYSYNHLLALVLIIFCFSLLLSSSVRSGFHLTDDHGIISIASDLQDPSQTFSSVVGNVLATDQSRGRMFPASSLVRVIQSSLLGTDFFKWSIMVGLIGVSTAYIMFWVGRVVGFSIAQSILLAAVSLIGRQTAVWWKLGVGETGGTLFLSLALLFAFWGVTSRKHKYLLDFALIMTVILMSLFKESFVLVIPGLVMLRLWFYRKKQDASESSWPDALKHNLLVSMFLSALFLIEILFIIFYLGLIGDGRAGIGSGTFNVLRLLGVLFQAIWAVKYYLIPAAVLMGVAFFGSAEQKEYSRKEIIPGIMFLTVWLGPQVVLHSQSGMVERYLLPSTIGLGLFAIYFWSLLERIDPSGLVKKPVSVKAGGGLLGMVILSIFIVAAAAASVDVYRENTLFSLEGKALNKLFQDAEKNVRPNQIVLFVADPGSQFEWSISIKKYFSAELDNDRTYLFPIASPQNSDFEKAMAANLIKSDYYNEKTFANIDQKDEIAAVFFLPGQEAAFLYQSGGWFDRKAYQRIEYREEPFPKLLGQALQIKGQTFVAYYKRGADVSLEPTSVADGGRALGRWGQGNPEVVSNE